MLGAGSDANFDAMSAESAAMLRDFLGMTAEAGTSSSNSQAPGPSASTFQAPVGAERERSRSRRRRGADRILSFGRHEGDTFDHVYRTDPGYCRWALSVDSPTGALREFASFLQSCEDPESDSSSSSQGPMDTLRHQMLNRMERLQAARAALQEAHARISRGQPRAHWDSDEDDDEGEDEDESREQPVSAASQGLAADIIARLPLVAYSEELFSGDPHPESCPICMEDFKDSHTSGHQILLTPCLHVFHGHCLMGWLGRKNLHCPSCRWDLRDGGEEAVRNKMAQSQVSVTAPADIVGATFVVSDDE